ncbi:MAG: hypothetical protein PHP22_10620, partial [Oscillospiraceae bacterium]|nr:hypothetical protein [Oscillospiraceae bacterium]
QLIPVADIGIIPIVTPIVLTAIALGAEAFRAIRYIEKASEPSPTITLSWKAPLIASWATAIAMAVVIVGWLQYGVLFG